MLRLGLSGGLLPSDVEGFDDACAAEIAALGFAALTLHLGSEGTATTPDDLDETTCDQIRETADRHSLRIIHSWGFGANLVHPDSEQHRHHEGLLAGALRVAAELGAEGVVSGAGSCHPLGGYRPHRDNHDAQTEDRLVESLTALAPVAESLGVSIALESHILTVLDSLADVAAAGHVKDVSIGDELVLRLDEVLIGQGEFDVAYFVARFFETLPDRYLFIEHLDAADVPEAKRRVDAMLAKRPAEGSIP